MSMPFKGHVVDADAPALSGHTVLHQWFRAFRAAVGTYVEIPKWNPQGAFRVTIFFETSLQATPMYLTDAVSNRLFLYMGSGVETLASPSGITVDVDSGGTNNGLRDGRKHKAVLSGAGPNFSITSLGRRYSNTEFWDGRIFSALLEDLTTPSNSRLYRNFTRADGIVPNELGVLGPDLFSTAATHTSPEWEVLGEGLYRRTSDGSWGGTPNSFSQDANLGPYLLRVRVVDHQGGTLRVYTRKDDNSGNDVLLGVPNTGEWAEVGRDVKVLGGGRPLWVDSTDFTGTVEMYLHEAPGYAQLHNDADGSIQRYTKKGQAWLGGDILSGIYPDDVHAPFTPRGAAFSIDGSQASVKSLWWGNVLTSNGQYRCVINVSESTTGGVRPENADINIPFSFGNGRFEWDFSTASNSNFNIQANEDFNGTVTFSLMPLIQIASGAIS